MLVTKEIILKIKKSFLNYHDNLELIKNNKQLDSEYDKKMFDVIVKIIDFYKVDPEKSKFLEKCLLVKKNWKQVYEDFYIEKRTYFTWKREIFYDAIIYAVIDNIIDFKVVNIKKTE